MLFDADANNLGQERFNDQASFRMMCRHRSKGTSATANDTGPVRVKRGGPSQFFQQIKSGIQSLVAALFRHPVKMFSSYGATEVARIVARTSRTVSRLEMLVTK